MRGNSIRRSKLNKRRRNCKAQFYENQNQIYSFTSDKLGWINIDKILAYEVEKEITFKNTNQDLKYFYFNLIYQNNQSLLNYNLGQFDTYLNKTKIIGKNKSCCLC